MGPGIDRYGRRRLSVGGAVMRTWLGIGVLLAGLGIAFANFGTSTERTDLDALALAVAATHREQAVTPARSGPVLKPVGERRPRRTSPTQAEPAGNRVASEVAASTWERPLERFDSRDTQQLAGWEQHIVPSASEASVQMGRFELAQALQTELRRVGCYLGDIDGDWGSGSRRAMTGFNERVNASLPVEKPDYILLTMVRRYDGPACETCRAGERMQDGRCIPNAVLANARGRDLRTADVAPRSTISVTGTAAPETERASQMTAALPAPPPRSVEPLPGRMSVGAVVDISPTREPLSREGAVARRVVGAATRTERRARVVERSSNSYYRSSAPAPNSKRWAQKIFDDITARQ